MTAPFSIIVGIFQNSIGFWQRLGIEKEFSRLPTGVLCDIFNHEIIQP
jgi:hypothetical protein